jgi:hypothetical protein
VSVRFSVDLYSVSIRVLVSSFGSAQLYQPFLIGPAATQKKNRLNNSFSVFSHNRKIHFLIFLRKIELYILLTYGGMKCNKNMFKIVLNWRHITF